MPKILKTDMNAVGPMRTITRPLVSPGELEVWRLFALGLATKEIAAQHGKSVKTIEAQKASLKQKLKARNTADLTRLAIQYRIITVEILP